jgi:hypothetical protein
VVRHVGDSQLPDGGFKATFSVATFGGYRFQRSVTETGNMAKKDAQMSQRCHHRGLLSLMCSADDGLTVAGSSTFGWGILSNSMTRNPPKLVLCGALNQHLQDSYTRSVLGGKLGRGVEVRRNTLRAGLQHTRPYKPGSPLPIQTAKLSWLWPG